MQPEWSAGIVLTLAALGIVQAFSPEQFLSSPPPSTQLPLAAEQLQTIGQVIRDRQFNCPHAMQGNFLGELGQGFIFEVTCEEARSPYRVWMRTDATVHVNPRYDRR